MVNAYRYILVLGDVVGSRQVADRADLHRRLGAVLKGLPPRSRTIAPYTVVLGDEFEAVYRTAEGLMGDVWAILAGVHPQRARLAVGVGEVTTPLDSNPARMDGPVFHACRDAMNDMKSAADLDLLRVCGDVPDAGLINGVLRLFSHLCEDWRANRFGVLTGLLRGQPAEQTAEALGISKVAVYKNIHAGALNDIVSLGRQIEARLDEAMGKP